MAWALTDFTTSVDLSSLVEASSLTVVQRAYANISTLSARIRDEAAAVTIATEHEIRLTDGGAKVFGGLVRVLRKTDTGVSGQRIYEIECQDFTTLLADDYVPFGTIRSTTESDSARIAWLFSNFGTRGVVIGASVVQLRATMPSAQDFGGLNLHQCLTEIASVTGGSFYVDYDKVLHYFNSETNAAPFGLSDNPNGTTTFGYEDFSEASDTVDFVNEVHVIFAGGSTTRYLGGSPPTAGTRRATVINDPTIPDLATAQARGDSIIGSFGVTKKPSKLVTYKPGLMAGQYVQVTHAGWAISATSYRIAGMVARPESKDRIRYEIDFGSGPVELANLLSGALGNIADANALGAAAAQGIANIADLSVGGANLVPNSSFEDGSSWIVGAQWAIGFTPGGGQLAFAGTDTARAVLAAQTAGDLVTPKITIDRNDQYVVSFWHFVRSRSSGTFRAFVKEYNAANTLLATTNLDFTAADAAWARSVLRFAPNADSGPFVATKIGWQATTAKIEIGFSSAGAAASLTVDVDGVQLERGEALTAYAPSPGEILAGTIGTTQIADDAITTPKLIASAVTAAKIAAGTITGDRIVAGTLTTNLLAAGTITLYGPSGETILDPLGFGPVWQRGIIGYIFNSDFVAGPPTLSSNLNNSTNALPRWTLTKASGTAIDVQVLADTGNGSTRALRFGMASGAASDDTYIEQTVPVLASQNRAYSFSPYAHVEWIARSAPAVAEAYVEIQFLKKDLSTTGTAQLAVFQDSPAATAHEMGLGSGTDSQPPADAYFARVRYGLRRKAAAATTATATLQVNETLLIAGAPRIHVPEINPVSGATRGTIMQQNGGILLIPDSLGTGLGALTVQGRGAGVPGALVLNGMFLRGSNAFPASPTAGDFFPRSDLGMLFIFDGTQWVCTCPHSVDLVPMNAIQPFSATQGGALAAPTPTLLGTDILIDDLRLAFFVASGGTALGASHKWDAALNKIPDGTNSGTTVMTFTAASGASGVWRTSSWALYALMNAGTVHDSFTMDFTKTGTPGTLRAVFRLTYRHVAT